MAVETYELRPDGTIIYHANPPKAGSEAWGNWMRQLLMAPEELVCHVTLELIRLPWGEIWCNENGISLKQERNYMVDGVATPHIGPVSFRGRVVLRKKKWCPGEQLASWFDKARKRDTTLSCTIAGGKIRVTPQGRVVGAIPAYVQLIDGKVFDPLTWMLNQAKADGSCSVDNWRDFVFQEMAV